MDPAFDPPAPDQVAAYLKRHPAAGPSRLLAWLPILALTAAVILSMPDGDDWLQVLPWVILASLLLMMFLRVRRARQLESRVVRVQELTMLRHYPVAMRMAWQLVPKVGRMPALHGRVVAFMAHVLDQLRQYDAAIVAYDHLIQHLPLDHPGSLQLQIQRAMAQLLNDQLADADDALRRLRGSAALQQPSTAASLRLAGLMQQVRTHHFTEAIESSPGMVDDLRPLGIEAGYGHALLALAYHMRRRGADGPPEDPAMPWWSRATLLLPPDALVERHPELGAIADHYPASPAQPAQAAAPPTGAPIERSDTQPAPPPPRADP